MHKHDPACRNMSKKSVQRGQTIDKKMAGEQQERTRYEAVDEHVFHNLYHASYSVAKQDVFFHHNNHARTCRDMITKKKNVFKECGGGGRISQRISSVVQSRYKVRRVF